MANLEHVTTIHHLAMSLADEGRIREALAYEMEAANLLANEYDLEPSRSVLYRSAASLAYECGELALVDELITKALAGNPPAAIVNELRELRQSAFPI